MPKTYFNDAIIGNSKLLACLTAKGELVRLFWPHPDHRQHFEAFITGLVIDNNTTIWLHDTVWRHKQSYLKDTNILVTEIYNADMGLSIEQTDFTALDKDLMVRRLEFKNTGDCCRQLRLMHFSSFISDTNNLASVLFDFETDALIHYRYEEYAAIFADREASTFQLGNNALESVSHNTLYGNDSTGMMKDGAMAWDLGSLEPGECKPATIYVCFNKKLSGLKRDIRSFRTEGYGSLLVEAENYWKNFIGDAKRIETGRKEVDELYKRSLLVFKLMCDSETGGILAAPEIDEEFTRCGRYAYCWGRDAGFIAGALDACGMTRQVDKFYEWAVNTQDDEGFWYQRYNLNGCLAPSWGLQIDETGTLVWGILQHYFNTNQLLFLEKMWDSVEKAVEFMIGFIDPGTGLPGLSFDLWEERFGVHAYSSAAVYGGIRAGAEIARILGKDCMRCERWDAFAESLRLAIGKHFWKGDYFLRSIRTKLNPWGNEPSDNTLVLPVNPKGYKRDFTPEDATAESSLLGLSMPFGVYRPESVEMQLTAERVENLLSAPSGGIRRYETDGYIGGNPWIVTTLWLGLYLAETGKYDKAVEYFNWAVRGATGLGLLPEQLDSENGKPAWVIPLTWSHAMFVLLLFRLHDSGYLSS